MINKENLQSIINDLKEVCKQTNLSISQEIIFQESCSYHRGMLANENRHNKETERKSEPITENQDTFIRANQVELLSLGFDLESIQNKDDAFKVISEYKKLKGEKNARFRK